MEEKQAFELEMDVIELEEDDGTVCEYVIRREFDLADRSYMVVSPLGEDDFVDDSIVNFYRVEEDGDDLSLDKVEDEEELAAVQAAFHKKPVGKTFEWEE